MTDSDPQFVWMVPYCLLCPKKRRPKRIRLSTMLWAKQLQLLWQAILRMQEFPKSQLKRTQTFFSRE